MPADPPREGGPAAQDHPHHHGHGHEDQAEG